MTEVRAALRVLAALCVATASLLLPAPPVAAGERCVGVVVDARLLGGDVRTGCAKGDPGNGLEALADAGFRYAFAPRQPGLVCQIDGMPECADTSTTTYWSYWYRAKGSRSWVYSSSGAGSHDPAPGSTEAWVWQDGGRRQPPDVALSTICPQTADRPGAGGKATSRPTKDRGSSPTASTAPDDRSAASTKATSRPSRSATASATRAPTPNTSAAGTTTAAVGTTSAPATTPPAEPSTAAAASSGPPGPDEGGGAPWAGLAVGAALVAALGGAAVARSRRAAP